MAQSLKIVNVEIAKLRTNIVQPPSRTTPDAIAVLTQQIQKQGLTSPIRVTRDMVQLDGHRRTAAYVALGHTMIPAVIVDAEADTQAEEFGGSNIGTRPLSGAAWFYGWARVGDTYLKHMPKVHAANIRGMIEIFGRNRAREMGLAERTPSYVRRIRMTVAALAALGEQTPTAKEVGEWYFAKPSRINATWLLIASGSRPGTRSVLAAIREDRDLPKPRKPAAV